MADKTDNDYRSDYQCITNYNLLFHYSLAYFEQLDNILKDVYRYLILLKMKFKQY